MDSYTFKYTVFMQSFDSFPLVIAFNKSISFYFLGAYMLHIYIHTVYHLYSFTPCAFEKPMNRAAFSMNFLPTYNEYIYIKSHHLSLLAIKHARINK